MIEYIAPTKSNLLNLKKSIKTAKQGYTLLDKKRTALVHNLTMLAPEIKKMQKEYSAAFKAAFEALAAAKLDNGSDKISLLANICVENLDVEIKNKSIMGISIPVIGNFPENLNPHISMINSKTSVDEAIKKFKQAVAVSIKMIELETTVRKLIAEIKKTQKRANALDYILIPKYSEQIKNLESALEEKDREEFFKVKMVKKKSLS